MRTRLPLALFIALLFAAARPAAGQLVLYTFTGAAGNEATFAPDAQPDGATASPMRRGGGLTPNLGGGTFASTGFTTDAARDTTDYYAFAVAPADGRPLTLTSLVLDERRSGTGIRAWAVYSSVNGFAAPLATFTVPDDANTRADQTVTLPAAFAELAGGVTFKVYGYAAEAEGGSWRIDNVRLFGSVGAGGAGTTVQFAAASETVRENAGTATLAVTITNPSATEATSVTVRGVAGGTATSGVDYAPFEPVVLTFPAGSSAPQTATVTILDDAEEEPDETIAFALTSPSRGELGSPFTYSLTILDDDAGASTLGAARAAGVGATVTTEGVVTRARGDFTRIQDATGALTIRQAGTAPFRADVASGAIRPGDLVRVTGRLSEFRGLLQLNEADLTGYTVVARDRPIPAAQTVTLAELAANGEQYESELVRVTGLTMSATGTFGPATTYPVTDATGSLDLRTPNAADTDLDGEPIPAGPFTFEGVLGQFNTYQLSPVNASDVRAESGGATTVQFSAASTSAREDAGTVGIAVSITNPSATAATTVRVTVTGGTATAGSDYATFAPVTLTFPAGSRAPQTVSITLLTDAETEPDETITFALSDVSGGDAATVGTPGTFTLTITDVAPGAGAGGTVCPDQTNAALVACLRAGYARTNPRSYSERTGFFNNFYPDADPATAGKQFRGVYTSRTGPLGSSGPNEINTEHTWPRSKMPNQGAQDSDMHNLYLTIASVNADRENFPLGTVGDAAATHWYGPAGDFTARPSGDVSAYSRRGAGLFEPRDDHKGNAARAVAYFYTLYGTNDAGFWDVQKPVLLAWNRLDPPDDEERRRNAATETYQGNLNPFVVDTTLIRRAYFTTGTAVEAEAPGAFVVEGAYPNPSRGAFSIRLSLPDAARVTVEVYDLMGRRVLAGTDAFAPGASQTVRLDASGLAAGVYLYRVHAEMATGARTHTGRVALVD